jgi:hypothetical protein
MDYIEGFFVGEKVTPPQNIISSDLLFYRYPEGLAEKPCRARSIFGVFSDVLRPVTNTEERTK